MEIRKSYGQWSEDNMDLALSAYRNGDMSLRASSAAYGIPRTTLKRHLNDTNCYATDHKKKMGRIQDLSSELEEDLVSYVLQLEERLHGVTRQDLKRLAYELAEANGVEHRFNHEKKMAGDKWYYAFMARHPNLSLRQPEATSMARARGFNKERVMEFFKVLQEIANMEELDAGRVFNVDESGMSTVQKPEKVISMRGKKQVGAITSGERGTNTTAVCCMSASGIFVPPLLIFKRMRFKDELKRGAPPGTIFACSESGWITSEIFVKWLHHFIKAVHPSIENKVLLVMDGHSTHTKNLEAINLARDNGIVMLCLPAHTTHRLQPLDVAFFKPLSTYFNRATDKWLREHPRQVVTQFHISELFGEAYIKAATMQNAISGFAKAGIWPVDSNVFDDSDFVASTVFAQENYIDVNIDTRSTQRIDSSLNTARVPALLENCGSSTRSSSRSLVTARTAPSTSRRTEGSTHGFSPRTSDFYSQEFGHNLITFDNSDFVGSTIFPEENHIDVHIDTRSTPRMDSFLNTARVPSLLENCGPSTRSPRRSLVAATTTRSTSTRTERSTHGFSPRRSGFYSQELGHDLSQFEENFAMGTPVTNPGSHFSQDLRTVVLNSPGLNTMWSSSNGNLMTDTVSLSASLRQQSSQEFGLRRVVFNSQAFDPGLSSPSGRKFISETVTQSTSPRAQSSQDFGTRRVVFNTELRNTEIISRLVKPRIRSIENLNPSRLVIDSRRQRTPSGLTTDTGTSSISAEVSRSLGQRTVVLRPGTSRPSHSTASRDIRMVQIRPLPEDRSEGATPRRRTTTATTILTSSPHKAEVEKAKLKKTRPKKMKKKVTDPEPNAVTDGIQSWYCVICDEDRVKPMIQCQQCSVWHHCACVKVPKTQIMFSCSNCN